MMNVHVLINAAARGFIRRAARNAPGALHERLQEEWLAHLSEQPPGISQLGFALGCYWAATVIERESAMETVAARTCSTAGRTMAAYTHSGYALRTLPPIDNPHSVLCDINTTPLIDVMLVLLVTLIVALPLMTHAVKLDLPGSSPPVGELRPEVVNVDIDFDGTVIWNGVPVGDRQQLESHFRTAARKVPQPEIHLRPDGRAKYDTVAQVLASAQRNQLLRIGFVNTIEFNN
jgi:biopolymer transport protein ExbD